MSCGHTSGCRTRRGTLLAEFVDNSTQSYFNDQEALDAAYEAEGSQLDVSIIYDKEGDGLIRVADNAMGMDYEELSRALHVGLPPETALVVRGMGLV